MNCPSCQTEVPDQSKFCHSCGSPIQQGCGSCGAENPPGAKFCIECGTAMGASVSGGAYDASSTQGGHANGPADSPSPAGASSAGMEPPTPKRVVQPSFVVPDAERRQMTVLFCDMVGSTQMSTVVDPEDLRDVISAYIEAAEEVIREYDGHVANYLGDGVLAYFGYPRAHENDARRACLAGLGIVDAVPNLSRKLEEQFGVTLAVRVGVHTGATVIGTVGGGSSREIMAVGETLNLASRLQDTAEHNTVVISQATASLVDGYFDWDDLGHRTFKGVDAPVNVFRIVQASGMVDRVATADEENLGPLVGREAELHALVGRWSDSAMGNGRVVQVRGGPGIGKSRLVRALRAHIAGAEHEWIVCRGAEYNADSPLHPVIEMAPQLWKFEPTDTPDERASKLALSVKAAGVTSAEATPLLCDLHDLPVPSEYPPLALAPQVQRERLLEALAELTIRRTNVRPVVLVVEDLQWLDQSTVDWLERVAARRHGAALLLLLVGRTELDVPIDVDSELVLRRLPPDEAERVIHNVAGGKSLPDRMVREIVTRADGNPLYVEELTKTAIESGDLVESDEAYETARPATELSIPASLQESLMARLDRIAPAKIAVQLGATVGRTFPFSIIQDILRLEEGKVAEELEQLVGAGILHKRGAPPDATYAFRHTLVRDAAYGSMTRKTRRHFHAQVAAALSAGHPDTRPELLAHHLTEAGEFAEAVPLWLQAGQVALGSFALSESINDLRHGLDALEAATDHPERLATELSLRVTLGVPLMLTQGFASAEVADHYNGLLDLCDRAGGSEEQLFPALYGLWTFYEVSAQYSKAEEMGKRLLDLGERSGNSGVQLGGHVAFGAARLMRGDLAAARTHFEAGLDVYDPEHHPQLAMLFGQDAGAMCASFLTWVHAHEGNRELGDARAQESLRLCEALQQPGTWSFVHTVLASYYCLCDENATGAEHARAAVLLGEEFLMPHWAAQGNLNLGWALQGLGQVDEAIELMDGAFVVWDALGTRAATSYFRGARIQAQIRRGNGPEAAEMLDSVFAFVEESDEQFYVAELLRLRAEVQQASGAPDGAALAASTLQEALDVANRQGANGLAQRVSA